MSEGSQSSSTVDEWPLPRSEDAPRLIFGIYPGNATGSDSPHMLAGPPDDPVRIQAALSELQDDRERLLVRGYIPYADSPSARPVTRPTPEDVEQYARDGRRLNLVLQFQSGSGDVDAYGEFVRQQVRRHGRIADSIQVTEEPNFADGPPVIDGTFPNVREALVKGVLAAKDEARRLGYDHLKVGFNAVPSFDPDNEFWRSIGELGKRPFVEALDFVGLDFFPDVFRPVAPDGQPGDLRQMVVVILRAIRESWMPAAGIPASVPIQVAENGWPTGPDRTPERQAAALETIIRTVHDYRGNYHISHYQLFDLRDADSANPNIFYQFGILRDDYTPKPAFEVYRRLIAEIGEA
jgi:hypothetical protein